MTESASASIGTGASAILAAVRELAPWLRQQSEEIEAGRRLTPATVDALRGAGAFRIAMPHAWGGPEMAPLDQISLIEAIARADSSAGWCTSILSDSGFYGGFLDDSAGRALFGDLDVATAGMLWPVGRARAVDGGYRLSGRWSFGSGCLHADRITGGATIWRNGEMELDATGLPRWRVFIVSPEDVEIHDTWYTTGLAGTGSNDYSVDDVFVPEEHSFSLEEPRRSEPLYRYHGLFFANVPGVPLGLGRRALDEAIALAAEKVSPPTPGPIIHDARVQTAIAEAEAQLGAARSYCWDVMGEMWETLLAGDRPSLALRARLALMILHTADAAGRAVDLACEVAGSTALFRGHPLERLRRDMIAVGSHVVHQRKSYAAVGRSLLGIDGGPVYF